MKLAEALSMHGRLTLQKRNARAELVEKIVADNDIVYTGREMVAKLFINKASAPISHIALGSGDKAVDPLNDTQLQDEIFRKAIGQATLSSTEDSPNAKVTITTELDFHEANGELREAGLFNAADPENSAMYNRVVFPVITKTTDFQLTLIWEVTF
jgi:hypothetical protein